MATPETPAPFSRFYTEGKKEIINFRVFRLNTFDCSTGHHPTEMLYLGEYSQDWHTPQRVRSLGRMLASQDFKHTVGVANGKV